MYVCVCVQESVVEVFKRIPPEPCLDKAVLKVVSERNSLDSSWSPSTCVHLIHPNVFSSGWSQGLDTLTLCLYTDGCYLISSQWYGERSHYVHWVLVVQRAAIVSCTYTVFEPSIV